MQVSKVVLPAQCILSLMCLTYIQCAIQDESSVKPDLTTNDDNSIITTPLHRIAPHHHNHNHNNSVKRYQVAKFDFEHVSTPYIISLWIIIVGLAKIGKSFVFFLFNSFQINQNIMFYKSIDSPIIQFSIIFHILNLI